MCNKFPINITSYPRKLLSLHIHKQNHQPLVMTLETAFRSVLESSLGLEKLNLNILEHVGHSCNDIPEI